MLAGRRVVANLPAVSGPQATDPTIGRMVGVPRLKAWWENLDERSPWRLGGLGPRELARRTWQQVWEDEVTSRAAELAYYAVLAVFPALLFMTALFGVWAGVGTQLRTDVLAYIDQVAPPSAAKLIRDTLDEVVEGSGGGKLSFGLLFTLWAASSGMGAVIAALNTAYGVKESRAWWRARLQAIALTLALVALIGVTLAVIFFGGRIGDALDDRLDMNLLAWTWRILGGPLAFCSLTLAFALVYYFGPNVEHRKWYWVTPGSAVAVVLFLLFSAGFRLYLGWFDSYNKTYGSLGAVIILLLWLYLCGAALMVGAEVNSEIEHAAADAGRPDAKAEGERQPAEGEGEPHPAA